MDGVMFQIGLVFLGVILPLFGRMFFLFAKWTVRVVFQKDSFLGEWFVYHFTTENKEEIFKEDKYTIRLRLGGYHVTTHDNNRPDLKYFGKLRKLPDGSLLFRMSGEGFIEEFYLKMKNPIPNAERISLALELGMDFDSRIYSTIYLFSRDRMEETDAKLKITEKARKTKSYIIAI